MRRPPTSPPFPSTTLSRPPPPARPFPHTASAARRHPRGRGIHRTAARSEEHTSEIQSPYVISYAVLCLSDAAPPNFSTLSLHDALPTPPACATIPAYSMGGTPTPAWAWYSPYGC